MSNEPLPLARRMRTPLHGHCMGMLIGAFSRAWQEEADAIDAAHVAGVSPELAGDPIVLSRILLSPHLGPHLPSTPTVHTYRPHLPVSAPWHPRCAHASVAFARALHLGTIS